MSEYFTAVAHPAGPLIDGKRHCAACGLELPESERWEDGERICIGELLMPYAVPIDWELDVDEIPCAGVIDVSTEGGEDGRTVQNDRAD